MHVVVAYVDSAEGDAALAEGVQEAARRGEGLRVIAHSPRLSEGDLRERVQVGIASFAGDVRIEVRGASEGEAEGEPTFADELIEASSRPEASRLVLGLRLRTHTGKLILGVNAQRVLLEAPIPVIAVKPSTS